MSDGVNPGVYSAAQPTALTISPGAGTTLSIAGIVIAALLLGPILVTTVRNRRRHLGADGSPSVDDV